MLFLSPENIRKPQSFPMFSGGRERVLGRKWVNRLLSTTINLKQGTDLRTKVFPKKFVSQSIEKVFY